MKLARLILMLFLVAGWSAAQCGPPAMGSDEKGKKDSAAAAEPKEMSCGCCKNMGKKGADNKDAAKADNKDAAKSSEKDVAKSEGKSEAAKSEGGMMAGGMGCCGGGKMGGSAMKCGGGSDSKAETPEQKMK